MSSKRKAASAKRAQRGRPAERSRRPGSAGPSRTGWRLRRICLAFPEVTERPSHGAPTWFVRDKSVFVQLWEEGHHQNTFTHLWCAAPPGAQEALIAADPERFFRPPYVGGRGWVGLRLDRRVDWDEIAELCEDAYRVVAPPQLVERLDARSRSASARKPQAREARAQRGTAARSRRPGSAGPSRT